MAGLPSREARMSTVGVGIIGAGAIALANHVPGLALAPRAKLVALCDADARVVHEASRQTGVTRTFADHRALLDDPAVDAVIVAPPNFTHAPIVLDSIAARKHVLCEKPLALDLSSALAMYRAAERSGVRHMTAFTYRFVPAMRYAKHLIDHDGAIGQPHHFRAQRFQDWGDRPLGWRQVKQLAGTGELGDMLSHRIDFAHYLIGPMRRLVANLRRFVGARGGKPADVDDWVGLLCDFESGATGVLESTKLATGVGEGTGGRDVVEINGADGSMAYSTQRPLELQLARRGDTSFRAIVVPDEFLVWPGSPRDPRAGDPRVTFRYDQDFEFIDAIVNNRPCRPSFREGVMTQAVMDAAVKSHAQNGWIDLKYPVPTEET
jgi:predicted dehydrogenase